MALPIGEPVDVNRRPSTAAVRSRHERRTTTQAGRARSALLIALSLLVSGAACSDQADRSAIPVSSTGAGRLESERDLEFDRNSEGSSQVDVREPASARRGNRPDRQQGRDGGAGGSPSRPVEHSPNVSVELGANDISGLLWMREEEQLAHDVYANLGERWDLRIFANIAASERRHVDSIVALLDRFGIDDPMADRPSGTFTIPAMQQRYDDLVAEGHESLEDALAVGVLIEEVDIVDLRSRSSDVDDIRRVYARLEQGSHRHLRAFVRQLQVRGVEVEPTRLDPGTFAEIVTDG
ncbi:DUF2202 domain-containing protein [Ilumatobacter sp.]|uniref:DUF2202 domain-containing protein n=1 Tax=Ilumatobacter sp. TaxID=1967498 RepID=UPI003AF956F5